MADNREAEPGAGRSACDRRAVEALEDKRQVRLVDPGPVIPDDDRAFADTNFHGLIGWTPLQRVAEDVGDRSPETFRVAAHGARLGGELEPNAYGVSPHALDLGRHDLVQADVSEPRRRLTVEREPFAGVQVLTGARIYGKLQREEEREPPRPAVNAIADAETTANRTSGSRTIRRGGTMAAVLTSLWPTSALWYFTNVRFGF